MSWSESSWTPAEAIQSVSRLGRKAKPIVYIDMETRSTLGTDAGGDVLCGAYKIGDGPVHVLPWPTVPLCRGEVDWSKADQRHSEFFAAIRRQRQLDHEEEIALLGRSWLTRKLLTFAAWVRNLPKR